MQLKKRKKNEVEIIFFVILGFNIFIKVVVFVLNDYFKVIFV
tara:strand:+ start:644 stop:769 length:126 start_codon:yes stop_codon:yes gene_type:complete